ncbi:Similar to Washc2: WASH complex subunit 2 (Mus musculus) [Cotesia congregata]|uniref:Similar to Washc2: WASH complex subunit 2 (Mus musculus) n=1 Tax=Cotesia congregata TaxID=51543 RepID=A0A8J2MYM3_COTCN|nr:Similar to Washc2: WASH complex subunit 2 (Mus musculus) [Cotesia congregata]
MSGVWLEIDLNETTVLIDNVTNASLALANTQFIESRVYEDDPSSEKHQKKKTETVDVQKELSEAEMIAIVTENIQRGLQIMDEKYDRLEVIASDDSDDENPSQSMVSVPSFILRPKDPYKDRPLPYVIGSDKWQASNKIGIESSSSESEALDNEEDDDDDDESTEGDKITHIFNSTQRNNLLVKRSSLSSSESSDFNDKSNNTNKLASGPSSTTDKLYTRSQDTLNSTSEIDTPVEVKGKTGRDAPGFAEELAKRLGSVLPDDLFDNEEKNEDIFNVKKDKMFSDGGLFDEDVPNSLWNNKPLRRPQSNIIPASIDLPPPIHSVEAKPKSSIDDLFGDVDSDDCDDIFAPRNSSTVVVDKTGMSDKPKNESNRFPIIDQTGTEKVATSTPDINTSVPNLFDDDEDDSLFDSVKNSAPVRSPEARVPGVLISQADLLSSSLGSKIFQRARQDSSESSETEESVGFKGEGDRNASVVTVDNVSRSSSVSSKSNATQSRENDKTTSRSNASSTIAGNRIHVSRESSDSSGISVPPLSISSNLSTSLGLERPQMESTRLISEELSRERLTSDSLLNQRSRQQGEEVNSGRDVSAPASGGAVQEHLTTNSSSTSKSNASSKEVNIFDDDVFSPPPLPKNDIKSKSKVVSLFDDSDSGDDLFSNTSSGSRSQKSADVLTHSNNNLPHKLAQEAKSKINQTKLKHSLFDDDNDKIEDIFGSADDSDIDIFARQKSKSNTLVTRVSSDLLANKASVNNNTTEEIKVGDKKSPSFISNKSEKKTLSIFDDSDEEDDDLFSTNTKIAKKPSDMFYGGGITPSGGEMSDDVDDLFAKSTSTLTKNKLEEEKEKEEEEEEEEVKAVEEAASPKKDSAEAVTLVEGEKKSQVKLDEKQNNSDHVLPSVDVNLHSQSRRLFDDYAGEDSDDEDSLFGKSNVRSQGFPVFNDSVVNIKETKITSVQISSERGDNYSDTEANSVSAIDGGKMSRITDNDTKIRTPPKSLKIKLPTVTADDDNESVSPPRRAVSGKIKNLMGKMGDLKILSPTDTPLTWRKAAGDNNKILQNRARIPVKRRPQSRQARQTALRTSGLDFDAVDTAGSVAFDSNNLASSTTETKTRSAADDSRDEGVVKNKHYLNLTTDDRSEMSLSKDGSISTTKNTLLSPSTDEEDLFDVPPDLPEDPPKEDSLFDQAPILSPVQARRSKTNFDNKSHSSYSVNKSKVESKNEVKESHKEEEEDKSLSAPIDPLRDDNHDPLKDPSQLFAFVTKTPSPEKGQGLLFDEDDSLFSTTKNEASASISESNKKSPLDLFEDDSSDLFSGPFTKPVKKSASAVKSSLFNDFDSEDDETEDLFASVSSRKSNQSKSELSDTEISVKGNNNNNNKQADGFEDDEDNEEELFFDASEKPSSDSSKGDQSPAVTSVTATSVTAGSKKTKLEDIFGGQSSGEEDIFFAKKPIAKDKASSFFSNEGESDDDLFAIKPAAGLSQSADKPIKKSVTRDLKKTAEAISEDPLSILHDD